MFLEDWLKQWHPWQTTRRAMMATSFLHSLMIGTVLHHTHLYTASIMWKNVLKTSLSTQWVELSNESHFTQELWDISYRYFTIH